MCVRLRIVGPARGPCRFIFCGGLGWPWLEGGLGWPMLVVHVNLGLGLAWVGQGKSTFGCSILNTHPIFGSRMGSLDRVLPPD